MNTMLRDLRKYLTAIKAFPIILIVFGLIGMAASIAISTEKTSSLTNPQQELVCDLNPVYSCSKVINSDQSTIFGFSNDLIGVIMFSILMTTGVIVLAGAQLKHWYWKLFLIGMLGFMGFVVWLFYQSVFVIGFLCILCSTIWFSGWTITTVGFSWMYDTNLIKPKKLWLVHLADFIRKNIVALWITLIIVFAAVVLKHFWYYYGQYFSALI